MAKESNIVHEYFKKEFPEAKILVRVNPIHYTGSEITVPNEGEPELRNLQFDEQIFEDLKADGFISCNPLEFNLYLSGLL